MLQVYINLIDYLFIFLFFFLAENEICFRKEISPMVGVISLNDIDVI